MERDIFILAKTLIVNKFMTGVETADENDIDNLMNDYDTAFLAEE